MSHKVRRRGAALSSSTMDDFAVGDHVVLSTGLPGRNDNVGIVVEVGDDVAGSSGKGQTSRRSRPSTCPALWNAPSRAHAALPAN